MYNMHGMAAFDKTSGPAGPEPDLEDILEQMFGFNMGGPMPGANQRSQKGSDEKQKYSVTLEDLYKGKTVKFSSIKNVICVTCNGKGGKERAKPRQCTVCEGRGSKKTLQPTGLIYMQTCSTCSGAGSYYNQKDKCKKCKGNRVTEQRKVLEIYIPRGSRSGDKIVLEGEADQVPGAESGDIIFELEEEEHPIFRRAGNDLLANIDISLAEALCGFSRVVLKHLDGRGIEIAHPKTPGAILRPSQVLKVTGEGMPHRHGEDRGDLYLRVNVNFPEDGFATRDILSKLESLLPAQGKQRIEGSPIDEVDYDPAANIDDFGARDEYGRSAWEEDGEDDDEFERAGPQCTTQ